MQARSMADKRMAQQQRTCWLNMGQGRVASMSDKGNIPVDMFNKQGWLEEEVYVCLKQKLTRALMQKTLNAIETQNFMSSVNGVNLCPTQLKLLRDTLGRGLECLRCKNCLTLCPTIIT